MSVFEVNINKDVKRSVEKGDDATFEACHIKGKIANMELDINEMSMGLATIDGYCVAFQHATIELQPGYPPKIILTNVRHCKSD